MFLPDEFRTLPGMAQMLETKSLTLEQLPVRLTHALDPRIGMSVRSGMSLKTYQEQTLDRMIYELNTFLLAEKLADKKVKRVAVFTHNVIYPKTWWQHFKQDVLKKHRLTRWYVKRWPVVHEHVHKFDQATLEVNLTQYATFPSADLILTPESVHKHVVVPNEHLNVFYKEHL